MKPFPRILIVTFCFLCAGLLGLTFQKFWGRPGLYIGCLLGTIGGMILTWAILTGSLLLFFPLPLCRQGKCLRFGKDFIWKKGRLLGYEGNGVYHYRCRCGDEYLRKGKKFLLLLSDGTSRPYKVLIGFRKWVDDHPDQL